MPLGERPSGVLHTRSFSGEEEETEDGTRRQKHHEQVTRDVEHHIARLRRRVGLEDIWSVEVRIACPVEMEDAEACISWDAEVWYARMSLRCTLSPLLLQWCVCHELCELQRWRSANCFLEVYAHLLEGDSTTRLLAEYRVARNQEIELTCAGILGHRRPAHIVGS